MRNGYALHLATVAVASMCFFNSFTNAEISKRHVQLVTPAPFEWAEYGPTNPLSEDGSDYPCKISHGDEFKINGAATEMVIGEEQKVSFSGWAVHGGGSCQFALTEGFAPTASSAWKVIHSIEGGCPKANVTGNLEQDEDPDTYTFTIPEDFDPGDYTWAWTWVNKIAESPEFYMNCAPITVQAAAGSTRRVKERREAYNQRANTYPDLFLANIGNASNGCDTSEALYEQIAIAYPYPGDSVSHPNGQGNLFKQPCDGNPRNNGAAASSGAPGPSATAGPPSGGAGSSLLSTSTLVAPTMSIETTSVKTTSSAVASYTAIMSTFASVSTSVTSSSAVSTPTSTDTTTLDSPCTDGHLLCVGGTQFSTCTGGKWDSPQGLAAGTTCKEMGESVGLETTYDWS